MYTRKIKNSTLHCIAICQCLWLSEEHVTVTELFLFCDVRLLNLLFGFHCVI